jgi:glycosyltransferase involved in cell wall biosynthesis
MLKLDDRVIKSKTKRSNVQTFKRSNDTISVMQYMGTQGTLSGLDYHVLMVCEHLDRNSIDVMLTCPVENRNEDLPARLEKSGVALFPFPTEGRDRLSYVKRTLALVRLLRRERVDVLHVHAGGFTGFNAFLAATFAGVRTIAVTHHSLFGLRPHSAAGRLSLLLEKRLASLVLTPYSGQIDDLASVGIPRERIRAVPNGVDLDRFSPTTELKVEGHRLKVDPSEPSTFNLQPSVSAS